MTSPIDPAQSQYRVLTRLYDRMDRDTSQTDTGPSFGYFSDVEQTNVTSPVMTLETSKLYDLEGRPTSIMTLAGPDGPGVPTGTLRQYDRLGRDTVETTAGVQTKKRYDAAGNVVWQRIGTDDNLAVTLTYDPLNRLEKRVVPERTYPQAVCPFCWKPAPVYPNDGGTGLLIPSDTVRLSYDLAGNLIQASNRYARVRRSYHPNGWMATDTISFYVGAGGGFGYSAPHGLRFEYDGLGRRVTLVHPGTVVAGGGSQTYSYHAATGALQEVVDLKGNHFTYEDDAAGRLRFLRTTTPAGLLGVEQEWQYDGDSWDTVRVVRARGTTGVLGAWTADTLRRNAQGKLTSVGTHGPAVGTAQLTLRYDGMGGLLTSQLNWLSSDRVEEYRRDALGNVLWEGTVGEVTRRPPATFQYSGTNRLQRRDTQAPTGPSTCQWAYPDSLKQTYDNMGNVATKVRVTYVGQGSEASCTTVQTGLELEFHWYTADNQLAVVQRQAGNPGFTVRTGTFEEYRYDPFGRRIRVLERRDSLANQVNMESAQTFTIWDGDRLLYEQRGLASGESAGSFFRYGTIGYIHGRELDAPLALTDGRIPLPDWRGQYQGSLWADGTPADCATSQGGKCTNLDWPAKTVAMTLRGWAGGSEEGIAYTWKGSIVSSNRDGTGMLHRRNRYYDPVTGRFTQVDPIGLAGGVNVYGFAEGDAVNFADPFGLCIWDICIVEFVAVSTVAVAGIRFVANLLTKRPASENVVRDAQQGLTIALLMAGPVMATSGAGSTLSTSRVTLGTAAASRSAAGFTPAEVHALGMFFGRGLAGAQARLADMQITPGITRDLLLRYREVAEAALRGGEGKRVTEAVRAVQTARIQAIEEALKRLK